MVPAKEQWCSAAGKVTAGRAESNDSLPPGGWLLVIQWSCTDWHTTTDQVKKSLRDAFSSSNQLRRSRWMSSHVVRQTAEWCMLHHQRQRSRQTDTKHRDDAWVMPEHCTMDSLCEVLSTTTNYRLLLQTSDRLQQTAATTTPTTTTCYYKCLQQQLPLTKQTNKRTSPHTFSSVTVQFCSVL